MSVEDASRVTKIRVRQIADLESDEYSEFANLAYARSFLVAYGKFLHVDTLPYMEAFADASTFGMDDYQYLSETPLGVYRSTRRAQRTRKPRRRQLIASGITAGLLAIVLFGRLTYITFERLGDVSKITARREALARATHEGKMPPTSDQSPAEAAAGDADVAHPVPVSAAVASADASEISLPLPVELPALTPLVPVDPSSVAASTPSLPLPGDGTAVREMLTPPPVRKPAYDQVGLGTWHRPLVFHADEPQPQNVVNNDPGRPVN